MVAPSPRRLPAACLLALLAFPAAADTGKVAPYDVLVDRMDAPPADVESAWAETAESPYFERPIPRVIHQIWLGEAAPFIDTEAVKWQAYARAHGYAYHLWTDDDEPRLRRILGDDLFALMDECRQIGLFMGASDVLRYVLLERRGGVYLDVDIPPPEDGGRPIDLAEVVPMVGAAFMSEGDAREIGNSAIYLQNCIMMAAEHHPIIRQLVASLIPNRDRWMAAGGTWQSPVWYVTGQHLLTRSLAGPFTLIPYNTIAAVGMPCFQDRAYFDAMREQVDRRRQMGIAGKVAPIHRDASGRPLAAEAWEFARPDAFARATFR